MSKVKSITDIRDEVAKGLKKLTTDDLIVRRLEFGEGADGYRWELYRGDTPFWVDLVRFRGESDILVSFSIVFGIPDEWPPEKEARLFHSLLEMNDFAVSLDTKFFLKEKAVLACASRSGSNINTESAFLLVDTFSKLLNELSRKIAEEFPGLAQVMVGGKGIEVKVEAKEG